jgi:ABC-type multidrug transport system fused ATPase/permease subunit
MTYDLSAPDDIALGSRDPGAGGATQAGFGAGREAVTAAASAAGLHELLTALPAGYDSMLSRIFADDGPPGLSRDLRGVGIRRADLIVVLRDGSVAEQGSHDAPMRSDGEYARLFRTQAQGFLNPVP